MNNKNITIRSSTLGHESHFDGHWLNFMELKKEPGEPEPITCLLPWISFIFFGISFLPNERIIWMMILSSILFPVSLVLFFIVDHLRSEKKSINQRYKLILKSNEYGPKFKQLLAAWDKMQKMKTNGYTYNEAQYSRKILGKKLSELWWDSNNKLGFVSNKHNEEFDFLTPLIDN